MYYNLRGEGFQILASLLSAAAVILVLFVHVGQINTTSLPRSISMVNINTSEYASTLSAISTNVDDFSDVYTFNASAPLNERAGLRQLYYFGLYSHCAYVNTTAGICSNTTIGVSFHPYDDLTADMPLKHSTITDALLYGTIRDSSHLGALTKAAYWLILIGSVTAFVALIAGWRRGSAPFALSTSAAVTGSLFLLTGASIWTDVARRLQAINSQTVGDDIPVGLEVSTGLGLYLLWGSVAALFLSMVPYMLMCCSWRG